MNHQDSLLDVFFSQELSLLLELEAEGNQVEITSGNIEKVSLELHSYGFAGSIQFSGLDDEKLAALYNSKKETHVKLTFQPTDPMDLEGAPLLEIKGIVLKKYFKRIDTKDKVNPYAVRHYEIVLCDNAQATWSEHRPINVYVDESMKDVLEAHKNPKISMKYDFTPLEQKHPIIAFSLASQGAIQEQEHFYSFFNWYLHQEGGICHYDYKTSTYSILGKKPPLSGEAYPIKDYWVTPPTITFQNPPRYSLHTLEHSSDNLDTQKKQEETAFTRVRKDVVAATNYRTFPEHAHEPIQSAHDPQHPEAEFEAVQLESDFHIDKLLPGSYVQFSATHQDETWSDDSFFKGKIFRSRVLFFEADKIGLAEKLEKTTQTYRLYIKTILELEEESFVDRPFFRPPTFPFTIQGKISSDLGDKEQSTYKISENHRASQGQYLVAVPLANNKNVVVPFTPDFMSGQYYFPYCKGERVLLSMYFHTAKIQRVIDWQPLARLPSGVQGNQIVLSSNGKDKYAIIKHEFEEGKNSVITVQQATSETQVQTIQIKDKDLVISVNEKDKKTITIQLNGNQGLVLTLEDKAEQMTQQIAFDGQQIITTCKNSGDTSTCTQTPTSVTIACKEFNVQSEKITLNAKDTIVQASGTEIDLQTPIANIKAKSVKLG